MNDPSKPRYQALSGTSMAQTAKPLYGMCFYILQKQLGRNPTNIEVEIAVYTLLEGYFNTPPCATRSVIEK